jgi:hypothetical protein
MWFRKAAEQGDVRSQYNLGILYEMGAGIPVDYAESMKWFQKAARQDHTEAQTILGFRYRFHGDGPESRAEAAKWFREAAEKGVATAQRALGGMYEKGDGVPQDLVLAHMWYSMAASNESEFWKREMIQQIIDRLILSMPPDHLARAIQLARDWKPKKEQ